MKAWTAFDRLSILWESELFSEIKEDLFQAQAVSILLNRCTSWPLMKCMKSLIGTTQECYMLFWTNPGSNTSKKNRCTATYLPSQKTILVRWTRHVGHCGRRKDKLISDNLPWTLIHGCTNIGQLQGLIYIKWADTGGSLEDLPEVMDDWDGWWESGNAVICATW